MEYELYAGPLDGKKIEVPNGKDIYICDQDKSGVYTKGDDGKGVIRFFWSEVK